MQKQAELPEHRGTSHVGGQLGVAAAKHEDALAGAQRRRQWLELPPVAIPVADTFNMC